MMRIAVLDDWQGIAEAAADWSAVRAKAEVVFFREHLGGADAVVAALAGFDGVSGSGKANSRVCIVRGSESGSGNKHRSRNESGRRASRD